MMFFENVIQDLVSRFCLSVFIEANYFQYGTVHVYIFFIITVHCTPGKYNFSPFVISMTVHRKTGIVVKHLQNLNLCPSKTIELLFDRKRAGLILNYFTWSKINDSTLLFHQRQHNQRV